MVNVLDGRENRASGSGPDAVETQRSTEQEQTVSIQEAQERRRLPFIGGIDGRWAHQLSHTNEAL